MGDRDLLLCSLDISLAFLTVFLLAFLAIRYDESAGPFADLTKLSAADVATQGTLASNRFVGIKLLGDKVSISVVAGESWSPVQDISGPGWQHKLRSQLQRSNLPVVVYEYEQSALLGDVVREVTIAGRPLGLLILY